MTEKKSNILSPLDLKTLMNEKPDTVLIDLLPPDHFENIHIPSAKNACVFFVSFLDDLAIAVADKKEPIVIYGSSKHSHDTKTAIEKMLRAGYENITELKGGIQSWREAGYDFNGTNYDIIADPQTRLNISNGIFSVNPDLSKAQWAGRNPNSCHVGTVNISTGEIQCESGKLSGTIEVDMHSIRNTNLAGDDLQPVLEEHLRSDDFFFTSMFPKAVLHIKESSIIEPGWQTAPNFYMYGDLVLRGVSAPVDFNATVNLSEDNGLQLEAHFDIDKTRWNIIYGSTRFFEHLGMHKIFDMISLQIAIVAHRQ